MNALNPPEWTKTETLEFPGSLGGWATWHRYIDPATVKTPSPCPLPRSGGEGERAGGIGTVRYPRLVAKDAAAARNLKARTLTNLYNESPTWLKNAHAKLDEAVFAAYGWDPAISDDELLAKLLALNLARSKTP